jgi:uncharacterized protein (DUF924 family)
LSHRQYARFSSADEAQDDEDWILSYRPHLAVRRLERQDFSPDLIDRLGDDARLVEFAMRHEDRARFGIIQPGTLIASRPALGL